MESVAVKKILCTGNPQHATVASAVKILWPDAHFASRTTGYDLRFWDAGSETFFREKIKHYEIFINSSFICNHGQMTLLETTVQEWTNCNHGGHIINIGSSAEFLGIDSRWQGYSIQKRALRDRSLQLHDKNGIYTTHLIAGGLNDGKPGNEQGLDLMAVANTIHWVLDQDFCVPLIYIESRQKK
jgi:hypothetical protein